ncbi:MAG: hypothetical protein WBJ10_11630 [Daejeonella sp.]|uniref:hypothetical protein n=1 Tax=Daejeonella sp. TaxID=2805397 RepID=UPI003C776659
MKSSGRIRCTLYVCFTGMLVLSSCNIRRADRKVSRSTKQLAHDISLQSHTDASFLANQIALRTDSANHEYMVRIFPVDTFSFSAERGFIGKASRIELAGTEKQVKASLESTKVFGKNRNKQVEKTARKTRSAEVESAKSTLISRLNWWLLVAVALAIAAALWLSGKLKKFV